MCWSVVSKGNCSVLFRIDVALVGLLLCGHSFVNRCYTAGEAHSYSCTWQLLAWSMVAGALTNYAFTVSIVCHV